LLSGGPVGFAFPEPEDVHGKGAESYRCGEVNRFVGLTELGVRVLR
jgi:hypothetical protein